MTTRRAAPLLAERLPLYATDRELSVAVLGERASDWPLVLKMYERHGFPPIRPLMRGRYVPAVLEFFDRVEGVDAAVGDGLWIEQRPQASNGVRARKVRLSRIG